MAPPYTTGLVLSLDAALGVYKDAAKTLACTAAGDALATWADQSGSGNDVVQATSANRPAYQPGVLNSLPVVRCAGAQYLANASFAGSSQSQTICIVYKPTARCVQQYLTAQGSFFTSQNTGQPSFYDTTTRLAGAGTIGISREFQLLTVVSSASSLVFRQNGANSATMTASASATLTGLTLFHLPGYTAYDLTGDIAEVLIYSAAVTGANLTGVENYLLAKYAIPAPLATSKPLVVVEGDSLSQGINTTSNAQEYPEVAYQGASNASPYNYRNFAVSGSQTSDLTNRAAYVDALYSSARAKNILYIWVGTNDMAIGGLTATQAYNALVTYCTARRAAGWKVIVRTMIPRSGIPDANRLSFNAGVRANWQTFADGLDDLGNDPIMGQAGVQSNTNYYSADQTHLTPAGYGIAATYASAAITKLNFQFGRGRRLH